MIRSRLSMRWLVVVLVIGGAALSAGPAQASTLTLTGSDLTYSAGAEVNDVTFAEASGTVTVTDPGAAITPVGGCTAISSTRVECPAAALGHLTVYAGAGADTVDNGTPLASDLYGEAGTDTLTGGSSADLLVGGDDADSLHGGAGSDYAGYADKSTPVTATLDGQANDGTPGENDLIATDIENLRGGSGDDTLTGDGGDNSLQGRGGADTLNGGSGGTDLAIYREASTSVTATLDGLANDGTVGENDLIGAGMDGIVGGSGDDSLTGNAQANTFVGGPGADTFVGLGGTDGVSYASETAPVTVSLDGLANDGLAGEGDLISTDIENVTGGSGADVIAGSAGPNRLRGGPGNDLLDGGQGSDQLLGSDGADLLLGSDGNDTLNGEAGDDRLTGGAGSDVMVGGDAAGPGLDWVDYSADTQGVAVDLDGVADDGEPGEDDTVATDIDGIEGGSGSDRLTGDSRANRLVGNGGNDSLIGGFGVDSLSGGAGADQLEGRDGTRDTLACGSAVDSATVDRSDAVAADCEDVRQPPLTASQVARAALAVPLGSPSGSAGALILSRRSLKIDRRGYTRVRLSCPRLRGVCRGRVVLSVVVRRLAKPARGRVHSSVAGHGRLRRVVVGRARFSVKAGHVGAIKVRISRRGRRSILRARRGRCRISVVTNRGSGKPSVVRRSVRLKAAPRARHDGRKRGARPKGS